MNMRFCVEKVAEPNRMAAQVLTTSPMKVRTLGLMRERASQRTMVLRRTPQARPKALVQERQPDLAGGFAGWDVRAPGGVGGCTRAGRLAARARRELSGGSGVLSHS